MVTVSSARWMSPLRIAVLLFAVFCMHGLSADSMTGHHLPPLFTVADAPVLDAPVYQSCDCQEREGGPLPSNAGFTCAATPPQAPAGVGPVAGAEVLAGGTLPAPAAFACPAVPSVSGTLPRPAAAPAVLRI
ncbi:hypothetical protein [Streptomyces sp. URMC 129]|uniref:hypothetical protein n=1 Tax=Streptomyces sp. URMC 129 TaxID=3423407 RepID=UPI003F1B1ED0